MSIRHGAPPSVATDGSFNARFPDVSDAERKTAWDFG